MPRTYTVRDQERVPVDRQAASVVAPGPKWCAPAEKPTPPPPVKPIPKRRAIHPRAPHTRNLVAKFTPEQAQIFAAFFRGRPSTMAQRNGIAKRILGMRMTPAQQAAVDALVREAQR